jgi:RNA polymerase sigma-70 factor (ECF subfamily)
LEENLPIVDNALFARMAQGDEEAFRQIVRFYHGRLFPRTVSMVKSEAEARDIMQEIFLKLWLNRTELEKVQNPGGWLRVVTAHAVSNHIRSRLRYELRLKSMASNKIEEQDDLWEDIEGRFAQSAVDEAIDHLPVKRKTVFLLSRREGLSRKEIAARLNISENTVRNQLAEATRFIQDYLRRNGTMIIPAFLLLLNEL